MAAPCDLERLGFDLAEHAPQTVNRLQASYSGYVVPGEVADTRDKDGQGNAVGLDRRVAGEASPDDSAVEAVDADITANRRADSEVVADVLDQP
jgi:hypothetical protein